MLRSTLFSVIIPLLILVCCAGCTDSSDSDRKADNSVPAESAPVEAAPEQKRTDKKGTGKKSTEKNVVTETPPERPTVEKEIPPPSPRPRFVGRVVDENGSPLRARIALFRGGRPRVSDFLVADPLDLRKTPGASLIGATRIVETNANGEFEIDELELGEYTVVAAAPGRLALDRRGIVTNSGDTELSFQLSAGKAIRGKFWTYDPSLSAGSVIRVLPMRTVLPKWKGGRRGSSSAIQFGSSASTTSAVFEYSAPVKADGTFMVEGVPAGQYYVIAHGPGDVTGIYKYFDTEKPSDELVVGLRKRGPGRGKVVDSTGAPVANAKIVARVIDSSLRRAVTADTEGAFRLEGLNGAGAIVWTQVDGQPVGWYTRNPISEPFVIKLPEGCSVIGRVTLTNGEPVSGAQVAVTYTPISSREPKSEGRRVPASARRAQIVTDEEGRFVAKGIEVGSSLEWSIESGYRATSSTTVSGVATDGMDLGNLVVVERFGNGR